jgi:hypothetical protein
MPSASDAFLTMMTGAMWQERAKQAQEAIVERTMQRSREESLRRRRLLDDEDEAPRSDDDQGSVR